MLCCYFALYYKIDSKEKNDVSPKVCFYQKKKDMDFLTPFTTVNYWTLVAPKR